VGSQGERVGVKEYIVLIPQIHIIAKYIEEATGTKILSQMRRTASATD